MVVVDTSIIYKWITEEDTDPDTPALTLLRQFLDGKENVSIPAIVLYELANALSTKTGLTFKEVEQAWSLFEKFNLNVINPSLGLIRKSIKFSRKYHVSVYDASYAVLALEKNCILLTADSKFAKKINLPSIKLLTHYPLPTTLKASLAKNKGLHKRVRKDWYS